MKTRAIRRVHDYEEQLVRIARKLPPEQVAQLVDFARFLEFRTSERFEDWLIAEAAEGGPGAGQAAWDDVLAKPEAKRVLKDL